MDHHGLLTLTRQLNSTLTGIHQARQSGPKEWAWHGTPVFYPETHCPFCNTVVRSQGIWFLKGVRLNRLTGALFPTPEGKLALVQPQHPHDQGGGLLCLGKNTTGIELLASKANLRDCPLGPQFIPRWLKKYWNRHVCEEGRQYIVSYDWGSTEEELLKELDSL